MKGAAKKKKPIDLGNASIGKLILTFAIPSILSHLVASIYNIVDQIFIGQNIGTQGTAASQVAYMLVLFMTATYVLISTGAASKFSLEEGEGESKEKEGKVLGNGVFLLVVVGIIIMIVVLCAKRPILQLLGAGDNEGVLDLACDYTWIIAIGFPFQMFAAGAAIMIRADGSPTYSMMTTLSGAVLNIGLDALFMMVFRWGIQGAALATIIGQIVSAIIAFAYFFRFKSLKFKLKYLIPNGEAMGQIVRLGLAAGLMQYAIMIVQTVMNNMLRSYGESDLVNQVTGNMTIPEEYLLEAQPAVAYASATALAVAGVVAKINSIFNATIYGIATSVQPVLGYNYGAKRYHRVLKTFIEVIIISLIVGLVAFTLFQTIPGPILHIFQQSDDLYDEFGAQYLRIFMGAVFLTAVPITVSNFFPSINMPVRGIIASISRQIIFQLPLILILPLFFGMDGVLFAGCSADSAACLLCIILVIPTVIKLAKAPADPEAPVMGAHNSAEPALATAAAGEDGAESDAASTASQPAGNVLYDADAAACAAPATAAAPAEDAADDPFAAEEPATEEPTAEEPAAEEAAAEEPVAKEPATDKPAAEEPAAEEPAAEETAAEEGPAEETAEKATESAHKYDYSFLAKVIQSPDEVRERYAEVVNCFLSFKGTNTRVSWKHCSLSYGRERVGMIWFKGKTLSVALSMDPVEWEGTKYHGKNIGDKKKYGKTPMLITITSSRKLTYAKHLIGVMMERLGAQKGGKTADVSYKHQTTEELIAQGLAKDLTAPSAGASSAEGAGSEE